MLTKKMLKYFRMQVALGKITEQEVQKKYPEFQVEDVEDAAASPNA